jgi:hypothetical protein
LKYLEGETAGWRVKYLDALSTVVEVIVAHEFNVERI